MNIEHLAVDKQINILFITETVLRCQRDEAKCVDMTPPGYSMTSFLGSTRVGDGGRDGVGAFIVREAIFHHAIVTASFPFSHF